VSLPPACLPVQMELQVQVVQVPENLQHQQRQQQHVALQQSSGSPMMVPAGSALAYTTLAFMATMASLTYPKHGAHQQYKLYYWCAVRGQAQYDHHDVNHTLLLLYVSFACCQLTP